MPAIRGLGNGFARFCRRHSVDEIPQLCHVARGEMSMVGPRPLTLGELDKYYAVEAAELLQVKPGLAGLWQISGRNRLSYRRRKQLDLRYVRERSVAIYLRSGRGRIVLVPRHRLVRITRRPQLGW
jgi:lipopolysaccharide/colanic/teichoic acid biosynthesis glycosyltransferase